MNYVVGFLTTVVALIVYILILKKFGLEKTRSERIVDRAIKTDCVTTASLKDYRCYTPYGTDNIRDDYTSRHSYEAWYVYAVNNIAYVHKKTRICYSAGETPEQQIELYYNDKKPVEAYERYSNEKRGLRYWIFDIIIPLIITYIILNAFGVIVI